MDGNVSCISQGMGGFRPELQGHMALGHIPLLSQKTSSGHERREGIATVPSPQVTFLSKLCIRMGSGPGPRQLLVARVLWLPLVRNQNIFQKLFSDLSFPGLVLIQEVIWHRQRIGKSLPRGGRAMNCKWKAIFPNAVRRVGSTDCWEGAHVGAGVEAEQ